jgi:hypothetical protein
MAQAEKGRNVMRTMSMFRPWVARIRWLHVRPRATRAQLIFVRPRSWVAIRPLAHASVPRSNQLSS